MGKAGDDIIWPTVVTYFVSRVVQCWEEIRLLQMERNVDSKSGALREDANTQASWKISSGRNGALTLSVPAIVTEVFSSERGNAKMLNLNMEDIVKAARKNTEFVILRIAQVRNKTSGMNMVRKCAKNLDPIQAFTTSKETHVAYIVDKEIG